MKKSQEVVLVFRFYSLRNRAQRKKEINCKIAVTSIKTFIHIFKSCVSANILTLTSIMSNLEIF